MEYRPMDITAVSAKDLKDVRIFSKMSLYAVVSLGDDPRTLHRTPVDKDCGKKPKWNSPIKFSVDEAASRRNRAALHFQIWCKRFLGDSLIGEVYVPITELIDTAGDRGATHTVSYQVRRPSGKPKGVLTFSYRLGEKFTVPAAAAAKTDEPVMAYPAAPGSIYPPPQAVPYSSRESPYQQPYAYPPPAAYPPAGYGVGAPPHGYGYGYPPQALVPPQAPAKKNKLGMGLGAGLLGGALGGLLIGDMISDASDYDAGYDAGLQDAGGFDF